MDGEKITLTGVKETMLATLYGRALDSRSPRSILHDREADKAIRRIDYDFSKTGVRGTTAAGYAIRAKQLDDWTAEFLTHHREATVLHLACGLDTRVHRLDPPSSVRWFDVDHPEVIELRRRLLSERTGDYQEIGASVTDDQWLDEIPDDRPTVAVFEGLSMYLRKHEGKRLIQRITERFPSGQLLFDCCGTLSIRIQRLDPAIRNAGATLYWGVDDPHEIEDWHDGLVCLDALRSDDLPELDKLPVSGRIGVWVAARVPGLRNAGRILRYQF